MSDNDTPKIEETYHPFNRLDKFDHVADKQIRDAMERGEFDNLAGEGKPLNLDLDRYAPPELRMAYRLMRDNDVQPEWIALKKEIDTELQEARQHLLKAARRYQSQAARLTDQRGAAAVRARLDNQDTWQARQTSFREAVLRLNRKINTLNLKVPSSFQTRDLIDAEREIALCLSKT